MTTEKQFLANKVSIEDIVNRSVKNKLSDFYATKYQVQSKENLKFKDYSEFKKIPILYKDELLTVPWETRTFVEREQVACVGQSSGTTNINKILLTPVSFKTRDKRLDSIENCVSKASIKKHDLTSILSLLPPIVNYYFDSTVYHDFNAITLPGDLGNLSGTAKLCLDYNVDGIVVIPTLLINFLPELEAIGFPLKNIRWITIFGEQISDAKLDFIKDKFPNAYIDSVYTSWEAFNFIGYRCSERDFPVNSYHPGSQFFCEILDEELNPVPNGVPGNLVITDLDPDKATPLIRYWTGDILTIEDAKCSCGNHQLLTLGGRKGYDNIRAFGVTFSSVAFENSLGNLMSQINNYEVHISEVKSDNKIKPKLTVLVDTKSTAVVKEIDIAIKKKFYLSKDRVLSYFIDNGIFEPLEIKQANLAPAKIKQQNIFLDF